MNVGVVVGVGVGMGVRVGVGVAVGVGVGVSAMFTDITLGEPSFTLPLAVAVWYPLAVKDTVY